MAECGREEGVPHSALALREENERGIKPHLALRLGAASAAKHKFLHFAICFAFIGFTVLAGNKKARHSALTANAV